MAESPATWDLITASLALCNLERPFDAWAFLVVQGLVRDLPCDRETFAEVAREEIANEITGPTTACRIASRLKSSGIGLAAGDIADPWGKVAAQRLSLIEPWLGRRGAAEYLREVAKWSDRVPVMHNVKGFPGLASRCREAWDRFWLRRRIGN